MSKKYHIRRREFLSKSPNSGARVIAVVEDARERHVSDPDSEIYQEISLHIGDDVEAVWLNFELYTLEDCEESLYKIRTLAEVVNDFKRAIEIEIEVISARKLIPKHVRISEAIH
jgi:hypothetical protein